MTNVSAELQEGDVRSPPLVEPILEENGKIVHGDEDEDSLLARARAELQPQSVSPPHPRSVLSKAAWKKISAAESEARALRLRVEQAIETRWRIEGSLVPIEEYIKVGQAALELEGAKVDAAILILPTLFSTYAETPGIAGMQLWQLLEWEVDLLAADLQLQEIQRNAVLAELKAIWDKAEAHAEPLPAPQPIGKVPQRHSGGVIWGYRKHRQHAADPDYATGVSRQPGRPLPIKGDPKIGSRDSLSR